MMKKKLALTTSILALLALFAGAAMAAVTVNDKPLDEIDDIMAAPAPGHHPSAAQGRRGKEAPPSWRGFLNSR